LRESIPVEKELFMTSSSYKPAYLKLNENGELRNRVRQAYKLLNPCALCGRYCSINRMEDEIGFCSLEKTAVISSYGPHFGEESPLVGISGSGTIFFSSCNLGCVFCQNFDISNGREGITYSPAQLAKIMLKLMKMGCHNINLVTPTHQMPVILESLAIAAEEGLDLPLVWNCGGYESQESLGILDGIVDIYMPDFKFWNEEPSKKYLQAPRYPEVARAAIKEMHRQVGDLVMDAKGVAYRGLLVRHLVMPENLSRTDKFIEWLADEISPNTYINIMDQYRPCFRAPEFMEINRRITRQEYIQAVNWAKDAGLRLDKNYPR
jgi:putative pyruvate formate lyase activating enzyme